jgi:ABC-type glycerol-3-phosphate transport system substrate-binding protein
MIKILLLITFLVFSVQAKPADIVLWQSAMTEVNNVMKVFVEEKFTNKTGISVTIHSIPTGEMWNKTLLAMASGETPDLAIIGSEWPVELGIRGGLVDMKAMFGKEYDTLFKQSYPGINESLQYFNTGFGLNASFGQTTTFYRTDIFAENGWSIPDTWDDLRVLLPKMQAKKMNIGSSAWYLTPDWFGPYIFMWQNGLREVNNERTKTTWDSPQAIKAFTEFTELFTKHNIPKEQIPFLEPFTRGEYPFVVGVSWNYADIVLGAPMLKGKWDICLMPGTKQQDGSINHSAYIGGNPLVMFKQSKNKEAAWDFLNWWLQPEVQKEYSEQLWNRLKVLRQPSNMEANNTLSFFPDNHRKILNEQAKACNAPWFALGLVVSQRYITNAARTVVIGNGQPEAEMKNAAHLANQEMARKQKEYARFIKTLDNNK